MKKIILLFLLGANVAFAQQEVKPIKVNSELNVDEKGNAKVSFSMKMTAGQWDNFKRSLGNNPSLLKRQMERGMPAYFLSGFDYKEDAMDRSYTLTFNAYGVCRVDESGKWVAEMDSKNPDVTKLSDNVYMLIADMTSGGQLIQVNQKIIFPSAASNIKEEKDSFGKARFTFDMAGASATGKALQYGGIGLIVLGILAGWRNSRKA